MATHKRSEIQRGAVTRAAVGEQVRARLNRGEIETKTLAEGLVVDFDILAKAVGIRAEPLCEKGIVKRMREASSFLQTWEAYRNHPSDTVRGWAAYRLALDPKLTFIAKLRHMRAFAGDTHFGVREWAWLSIRDELVNNLSAALEELVRWTKDSDANVRRFASEATRPRGVWCAHILALKTTPELGEPILEPLRADASKYVRDSVGNWINDASKSRPDWSRALALRWSRESKAPETALILKRALRSLRGTLQDPIGANRST